MSKIRWSLAVIACMFGAATLAEIGQGHDLESIAMTAIPTVLVAAAWFAIDWVEFRR